MEHQFNQVFNDPTISLILEGKEELQGNFHEFTGFLFPLSVIKGNQLLLAIMFSEKEVLTAIGYDEGTYEGPILIEESIKKHSNISQAKNEIISLNRNFNRF